MSIFNHHGSTGSLLVQAKGPVPAALSQAALHSPVAGLLLKAEHPGHPRLPLCPALFRRLGDVPFLHRRFLLVQCSLLRHSPSHFRSAGARVGHTHRGLLRDTRALIPTLQQAPYTPYYKTVPLSRCSLANSGPFTKLGGSQGDAQQAPTTAQPADRGPSAPTCLPLHAGPRPRFAVLWPHPPPGR